MHIWTVQPAALKESISSLTLRLSQIHSFFHTVRQSWPDIWERPHIVSPPSPGKPETHTWTLVSSPPFKQRFRSARRTSSLAGCCWSSRRLGAGRRLQTLRGWLCGNSESCTLSDLRRGRNELLIASERCVTWNRVESHGDGDRWTTVICLICWSLSKQLHKKRTMIL